jgi:hypothetical protein
MLWSRLRPTAWIGVTLLLAGCDPRVMDFDVQPRRACAGDSIHITWRVRGTPHLETARRTEDSVDIIRYTIVAESRKKKAFRALDVVTFRPGAPAALALRTEPLGADSLVARDSLRAAPWHGLLRVGDVVSDSGREILVRHAGVEALVGPERRKNSAWRGKPVSGAWEIRSGLTRGEVRGKPTRHPPTHLYLGVNVTCESLGPGPVQGPASAP